MSQWGSIKSQAFVDFVEKLSSPVDEETPLKWTLYEDGVSNIKGSGVGIVLEGPGDILIEHALKFKFTASNNQEEYESLNFGIIFTLEMGALGLKAKIDSKHVANQVFRKY